mmetsp:Transcript_26352/g.52505  ORF Transcript_26352/g.52505 Transcript_26352/m.52505 type:complete len:233 (-) Transcript_26352:1147-1845(-)
MAIHMGSDMEQCPEQTQEFIGTEGTLEGGLVVRSAGYRQNHNRHIDRQRIQPRRPGTQCQRRTIQKGTHGSTRGRHRISSPPLRTRSPIRFQIQFQFQSQIQIQTPATQTTMHHHGRGRRNGSRRQIRNGRTPPNDQTLQSTHHLHLQRPILPKGTIPRPILPRSQIPTTHQNHHRQTGRGNRTDGGDARRTQRRGGGGRIVRKRYPTSSQLFANVVVQEERRWRRCVDHDV